MTKIIRRSGPAFVLFLSWIIIALTGCVKQEFDTPPIGQIPLGDLVTIEDLYQLYEDEGTYTITDDQSLYAVVTMDETSGNIYRSAFIQDATGGINLHLLESGGLRLGDSIRVYLKNCILSTYNDLHQIDNVDNDSNIIILANQKYRIPEIVTISQIQNGGYESHLVELGSVQFMSTELGKTYADAEASANRMLEDCNGNSLIVRTSNYANFATTILPEGNGNIIGVVSKYGADYQLYIRTEYEVALEGERCEGGGGGVTSISEDFETQSNDVDIELSGWLNEATIGSRLWRAKEFESNLYAQATSFNSNEENESWLITPPIDLDAMTDPKLTFESAQAYWTHDGMTVWISTDFNGVNIAGATWVELNCILAGQTDPEHDWIFSGVIDLSAYSGTAYLGFRYIGNGNTGLTTSYRIDNVQLYDE